MSTFCFKKKENIADLFTLSLMLHEKFYGSHGLSDTQLYIRLYIREIPIISVNQNRTHARKTLHSSIESNIRKQKEKKRRKCCHKLRSPYMNQFA